MSRNRIRFIDQKRSALVTQLSSLENAVANNAINRKNATIRLKRLTDLLHAFEDLHDELSILDSGNERLAETYEIQNRYYAIASEIESAEGTEHDTNNATSIGDATFVETQRQLKLPIAELPKFDGNIEEWLSYKHTFLTMIEARNDISDVVKFLYLKNSLGGEALTKISIYNASAENYKSAWKTLLESYEKKRILINKHFDAILDMSPLIQATPKGLTKIVDETKQHLAMLKTLEETPEPSLVLRVLERTLPNDIRQKWEETLNLEDMPNLDQFFKFITETAFRLCTIDRDVTRTMNETIDKRKRKLSRDVNSEKIRRTTYNSHSLITSVSGSCPCCADSHAIYGCNSFKELTIPKRWEIVKSKKLCRNCLRSHSGECRSSRCRKPGCGRFHHTLLHNEKTEPPSRSSKGSALSSNETA